MTQTNNQTDNIINRDELQNDYVDRVIDGLDIKDLCQIVSDYLHDNLDKYSVDELITEVEETYPDLLEEKT